LPERDSLERRTIRAALKREGWDVESHVDGTVDVFVPSAERSLTEFRAKITARLREFGYTPTFVDVSAGRGRPHVRFTHLGRSRRAGEARTISGGGMNVVRLAGNSQTKVDQA
jgi:hypothetical protein